MQKKNSGFLSEKNTSDFRTMINDLRFLILLLHSKIVNLYSQIKRNLILFKIKIGDYLLSHTPAHAVPSAYRVLTSLFGMGRGVSPWL